MYGLVEFADGVLPGGCLVDEVTEVPQQHRQRDADHLGVVHHQDPAGGGGDCLWGGAGIGRGVDFADGDVHREHGTFSDFGGNRDVPVCLLRIL